MLEFTTGNLLADRSEALVNTVNCVGVMGRGVALQFKQSWPANFAAYAAACKRGEVEPGRMFVFETGALTTPRFIINFPTKRHWRAGSRIEDIEAGLHALVAEIRERGIRSIALPPLGAGLGGLDWTEVRSHIVAALGDLPDVEVRVYEPGGAPASMPASATAPDMTPGRAALVSLMDTYLRGLLDPTLTLLEIHKLMYFLQEAGQPLRLKYQRAPYGPYAENLRHVLKAVENHYVTGYRDGGDAPSKELALVPGALASAEALLAADDATRSRLTRVRELVEGFESAFGMELLATVHWLYAHEDPPASTEDAVRRVHDWGARKRQFTPRQIGLAVDRLQSMGWIATGPT